MWKSLIFSFGIGLRILGGGSDAMIGVLAMSVLGGILVVWACDRSLVEYVGL